MPELSPKDKIVLVAFNKSGYSVRTASGLSKDAQLPKTEIQASLSRLMSHGLVDQVVRDDGVRFYLTREGRVATVEVA